MSACAPDTEVTRSIGRDAVGRADIGFTKRYGDSVTDTFSLEYGPEGRIAGVDQDHNGVAEYAYTYDHRSLRLTKSGPAGTRRFSYDQAGRLISEVSPNGAQEYLYVAGVPVAVLEENPTALGGVDVYVLGLDHLGTPMRAMSVATGEIAWAADYEAFGRAYEYVPRSTAAPSIEINLRFPGQYLDRETGLHYNWHRYYSPELGRYLTPDPVMDPSSVFTYAMNRPCCIVDPMGLFPVNVRCPEGWTQVGVPRLNMELDRFTVVIGSEGRFVGTVQLRDSRCRPSGIKQCNAIQGSRLVREYSADSWSVDCEKEGTGCSGTKRMTVNATGLSIVSERPEGGAGTVYADCQCVSAL